MSKGGWGLLEDLSSKHETLNQCWVNVGSVFDGMLFMSPTIAYGSLCLFIMDRVSISDLHCCYRLGTLVRQYTIG